MSRTSFVFIFQADAKRKLLAYKLVLISLLNPKKIFHLCALNFDPRSITDFQTNFITLTFIAPAVKLWITRSQLHIIARNIYLRLEIALTKSTFD